MKNKYGNGLMSPEINCTAEGTCLIKNLSGQFEYDPDFKQKFKESMINEGNIEFIVIQDDVRIILYLRDLGIKFIDVEPIQLGRHTVYGIKFRIV